MSTTATASAPAATPAPPATPADAVKPSTASPAGSGQPTATPPKDAAPAATSQPADDKSKAPAASSPAAAAQPAEDGKKDDAAAGKADGGKTPTAEEAKAAAEKALADLKLPEGSVLTSADLDDIRDYAKEKGLTPDQAAGLVERENLAVASFVDRTHLEHKEKADGWDKACREHKEFGGTKYPESSEAALRALKTFFSPELAEELAKTRYGSYPPLWEGLVKAGLAMKDDSVSPPSSQQSDDVPTWEAVYGKDGFGRKK
jgi:hypothetical protein